MGSAAQAWGGHGLRPARTRPAMMRIAVIGNGPSPVGRALGAEIDACDLVVRLHDCQYQAAADYGVRYDKGVLPGPWLKTALAGVRRLPSRGWWVYAWGAVGGGLPGDAVLPPGSQVCQFWDLFDRVRVQGKAPSGHIASLSRGFCALAMAMRANPGAEIAAYGFDALFAADGAEEWPNPEAYREMASKDMADFPVYHAKAVHHDAEMEMRMLAEIAESTNTKLVQR